MLLLSDEAFQVGGECHRNRGQNAQVPVKKK